MIDSDGLEDSDSNDVNDIPIIVKKEKETGKKVSSLS